MGFAYSGIAGPLAARGGGHICRPFVLGLESCGLKHKSPARNWRSTNKVEADAAKDPML